MKTETIIRKAEKCYYVYRLSWTYTNMASTFTYRKYYAIANLVRYQYENLTWNSAQKVASGIYLALKAGICPETPIQYRSDGLYVWTNYFGVKKPGYIKGK